MKKRVFRGYQEKLLQDPELEGNPKLSSIIALPNAAGFSLVVQPHKK